MCWKNVINLCAGPYIFPWSIWPGDTMNPLMKRYEGQSLNWPSQAALPTAIFSLFPFLPWEQPQCSGIPYKSWICGYTKYRTQVLHYHASPNNELYATGVKCPAWLANKQSHTVIESLYRNWKCSLSCGFLYTVVCGHILSRVFFLEHGKLVSQTFD